MPRAEVSITQSRDASENRRLFHRGFPYERWVGDHHVFWIARCASTGRIAGFCSAVFLPSEHTVFLSSAYVFSEFRGRQIQRTMLRHRLRWAKRQGATTVVTYTVEKNWRSATNLLRMGFHAYEPAWPYVGRAWYFQRTP